MAATMTGLETELAKLEERVRQLELVLARMSGTQALLPYIAVVVTGLVGLGLVLSK